MNADQLNIFEVREETAAWLSNAKAELLAIQQMQDEAFRRLLNDESSLSDEDQLLRALLLDQKRITSQLPFVQLSHEDACRRCDWFNSIATYQNASTTEAVQ